MKKLAVLIALALMAFAPNANAHKEGHEIDPGYRLIKDIPYYDEGETDAYRLERCKLDIYYPEKISNYATLVWIHGGGLTEGQKHLMDEFRNQGFAVVSINYRLSPKATCPAYIDDAAQACAWVFKHIAEYGGDPDKVFLSGHSAGGYLDLMVLLDKSYMEKYGADADRFVKVYPISGQTATHYTIRRERKIAENIPVVDQYAPLNCVRKTNVPVMLITGGRDLELLARAEENIYLLSLLKSFGVNATLYELPGFDHGTVLGPAAYKIRADIKKLSK